MSCSHVCYSQQHKRYMLWMVEDSVSVYCEVYFLPRHVQVSIDWFPVAQEKHAL